MNSMLYGYTWKIFVMIYTNQIEGDIGNTIGETIQI